MTETDDTIELECHEELDLDPVVYNFYDKYKASQYEYAPEHDHFGTRSKYDGMREFERHLACSKTWAKYDGLSDIHKQIMDMVCIDFTIGENENRLSKYFMSWLKFGNMDNYEDFFENNHIEVYTKLMNLIFSSSKYLQCQMLICEYSGVHHECHMPRYNLPYCVNKKYLAAFNSDYRILRCLDDLAWIDFWAREMHRICFLIWAATLCASKINSCKKKKSFPVR